MCSRNTSIFLPSWAILFNSKGTIMQLRCRRNYYLHMLSRFTTPTQFVILFAILEAYIGYGELLQAKSMMLEKISAAIRNQWMPYSGDLRGMVEFGLCNHGAAIHYFKIAICKSDNVSAIRVSEHLLWNYGKLYCWESRTMKLKHLRHFTETWIELYIQATSEKTCTSRWAHSTENSRNGTNPSSTSKSCHAHLVERARCYIMLTKQWLRPVLKSTVLMSRWASQREL